MQEWYRYGRYMLTQNGYYSISRSYLAIIGQGTQMEVADLVWTSMALPRHRFMLWLAVQGRLLTKERKLRLHIQVDDTECCVCEHKTLESIMHLFVECRWSKIIWQEMKIWTGITLENTGIKEILEKIKPKHWKKMQKEVIAAIYVAVIYHTWRARNWKKFKGKTVHTEEAVMQIKKEIKERLHLIHSSKKAQKYYGELERAQKGKAHVGSTCGCK